MRDSLRLPRKREITGDANLLKRIAAFMIDIFIVDLVISQPFSRIIEPLVPEEGTMNTYNFLVNNPAALSTMTSVLAALGFLSFLYFVLFEYILRQTPGKMIMSLFVEAYDKKERPKFWQCIVRNLFLVPNPLIFALWITDFAYLLFKKQRLFEIWSKTKVVEVYRV